MNIQPKKTQIWSNWYWSVSVRLDENEYDSDPAWATEIKGRGLVGGVLIAAEILSDKPTLGGAQTPRVVTIRATVLPVKKDGSFYLKAETVNFDETNWRFARLPEPVQDAYRTFCQSVDEVLRREEEIDTEERHQRQELANWWTDLYAQEEIKP